MTKARDVTDITYERVAGAIMTIVGLCPAIFYQGVYRVNKHSDTPALCISHAWMDYVYTNTRCTSKSIWLCV